MAYYRYRGNRGSYDAGQAAALKHIEAFREMERRLGPVVSNVRDAFLNLGEAALCDLLNRYGRLHGKSAHNYALKTYGKWKNGHVKMSGMVAERLLNLVPRYLTFDQRFLMVEKLCNHHTKRLHRTVKLDRKYLQKGIDEIRTHINEIVELTKDLKYLPDHVVETVKWLNDDDVVASRKMLAEVDQNRNRNTLRHAQMELERIIEIITTSKGELSITQHIELACGSVSISSSKRRIPLLWLALAAIAAYLFFNWITQPSRSSKRSETKTQYKNAVKPNSNTAQRQRSP